MDLEIQVSKLKLMKANHTSQKYCLEDITRINHVLESVPKQLAEAQTKLENVECQFETAKTEVEKPFAQETELAEKLERLAALNALLNMDEKGDDAIGMEDEPGKKAGKGKLPISRPGAYGGQWKPTGNESRGGNG